MNANSNTVAANGADSTNGNTAAAGFNSFVAHEDFSNPSANIVSGNGSGVGGESAVGARADSGTGAGQ